VGKKRRVHFLAFMQDVHGRIHDIRRKQAKGKVWEDVDPVTEVARLIAQDAWLLCFDEFQVTDITDAMLLSRLFAQLFDLGVVMVATSNTPPEERYADGLNRQLFTPFIDILHAHADVLSLDGEKDYRLQGSAGGEVWFSPLGPEASAAMDRSWLARTGVAAPAPMPLDLGGRILMVPRAAAGAARFSFSGLCEKALGAADYLAIAQSFDTLFIDDIPVIPPQGRNEARRFITLIDALYDSKTRLVASAAGEPGELYGQGPLQEAFLRTVSRLEEMRRPGWG